MRDEMPSYFRKWYRFSERGKIRDINRPGVYALIVSDSGEAEEPIFAYSSIAYIGMTASRGGLISRLNQFSNTINGKEGHGGAYRFLGKYSKEYLDGKLYVSVIAYPDEAHRIDEISLRTKGEILKREQDEMASYYHEYNRLPEFNDMKKSPKYQKNKISA